MKKFALIFVFAMFFTASFAQNQNNQNAVATQQQNIVLKPKVFVEDLVLCWQLLANIEIKATEVDLFLNVKSFLKPYIEKIQKENLQLNSNLELSAPLNTSNSMIQFLERATIPAAQAERYKRFILAFQEAAKNYKP